MLLKISPKRTNFTSIQSGHTTPMDNQMVLPVRSQYASVIGHRLPDKYVVTAKQSGKVTGIDKNSLTIRYKDGEKLSYKLTSWFSKEIGGITYKHQIETGLSKGSVFKIGDVLTYDSKFFGLDMFDKTQVVYKTGVILRTVFIEDSDTYEDSISISKHASRYLSINTTKTRSIVIDGTYVVNKIKELGDTVGNLDPLLIMSNVIEDEIATGEALNVSDETLGVLADLNDNSPKAKYAGTIVKRQVYYNTELKHMSPGLKKLVKVTDAILAEEHGEGMTGQVTSGYRVKGKALEPGELEIKFYIEDNAKAFGGDKFVFGNQLKGTISTIFDDMTTETNRLVEAEFSTKSEAARIVNSTDLLGVKTTILREASLIVGNM